jgi:transcriptional antiterminator RfaH
MRWYVVQTQSRAEERALWHLENQGFQCFLPRFRKQTRHARRSRSVLEPLFPRYLFAQIDLNATAWRSINGTRGVVALLANGPKPMPVPEGMVERLMADSDDAGITPLSALGMFWQGRKVKITSGAFRDQFAEVEAVLAKGCDRVAVLLDLLGTPTRLQLPSYAIQAI